MDFGERLKGARKAAGLSQEQVARRADIGLRSYGELERGHATDPHISTVIRLARALGVPVTDLIGEEALLGKAEAPRELGQPEAEQVREPQSGTFAAVMRELVIRERILAEARETAFRERALVEARREQGLPPGGIEELQAENQALREQLRSAQARVRRVS